MPENVKTPDKNEMHYLKVDLWLNESQSGNAIMLDNGDEKFSSGKSIIEKLIDPDDDEVETVTFSEINGENDFSTSEYFLSLSKSTKAIVLNYHDEMFVQPVEQVKRLLNGEIEGSPFFLPVDTS